MDRFGIAGSIAGLIPEADSSMKRLCVGSIGLSLVCLSAACGSKSNDVTGPGNTAVVDVNGITAGAENLPAFTRYTVDFNLIERGGVAIVVDTFRLDFGAAGFCTYAPSDVIGSNRIVARANRYAHLTCNGRAGVTSTTVSIPWNDDNGHHGVATATATIR
jgi:hypothetical protein